MEPDFLNKYNNMRMRYGCYLLLSVEASVVKTEAGVKTK